MFNKGFRVYYLTGWVFMVSFIDIICKDFTSYSIFKN